MNDFGIREYQAADIPSLTDLWHRVFGDPVSLISAFFQQLPDMGGGVVAVRDGAVVGAAYMITGLTLKKPDGAELPCGYLYAVAVDPVFRGNGAGAALSRAAFAWGQDRGCRILCTQPAEPGLFSWYKEILGVDCVLRRREDVLPAGGSAAWRPIAPADYGARREALLAEREHLCLSPAALRFQQALCQICGGDLYAAGEAVAAAYRDEDSVVIPELLPLSAPERASAAASLAALLGGKQALLRTPDARGEPYLAAAAGCLSTDCVWDLSFD